MYLKEIRTYGFKSFADKTTIEFNNGINGIVGPNGSGKSNIVDAVRWVLGEQSNKSLRAENQVDVIFSGSKSRKPLNSASVTLVFDNSDHYLALDFDEIAIKRVLFRTGESEFYINNERCRLKDINDLLIDTGIAKESFNIISQGKIDEILSTHSSDRRVIFEEAAGVLKYKKRKEEALRKLEKTNDNVSRVNDIILELEANINPLREQSNKAKKYLECKDKLKDIEVALIANDISKLNLDYQDSKTNIEKLNDEILQLNKNNANYDVSILKEKNKLKEIEDKINSNQTKLLELTKQSEQLQAEIRIAEERKKYVDDLKIENNLLTLRENVLKLKTTITNLNLEKDIINKNISNLDLEINDLIVKYNELNVNKNKLEVKLNNGNLEVNNLKYKIDSLELSISNNDTIPNAVKNIKNNKRFTGVFDVIGNLIEVEDEYKLAISTALSSSIGYLVVDTSSTAKVLVNYLKENNLGRATFYPLDVILARYIDEVSLNNIKNVKGYIDIASNLVTYDLKYQNIILNQLGNVIVTSDVDTAVKISLLVNKRYKIVTLDGQVVNVGGSITGGSRVKTNNVILQKYELDKLRKNLENNNLENEKLQVKITNIIKEINDISVILNNKKIDKNIYLTDLDNKNLKLKQTEEEYEVAKNELDNLESISHNNDDYDTNLLNKSYDIKEKISTISSGIEILNIDRDKINKSIMEIENTNRSSNSYILKQEKILKDEEIKVNRIEVKLDNLLLELTEDYNMTFDYAKNYYKLELEESLARQRVLELKEELKNIGIVNLGAVSEFERVSTRYEFLVKQRNDLINAKDTLLEIIKEMDGIMEEKFLETFELIRKEFKVVFRDLFKGGDAELILTDPDNILETGIEIKALPPGKKLQNILSLSGGEKTFTAISLLFAILNVRPVAFCLLDEVEAALDDANVSAFGNYLSRYKDKTQFILITHKKKTMEFANILYGITMQEAGVSRLVSVKLEDIENEIK